MNPLPPLSPPNQENVGPPLLPSISDDKNPFVPKTAAFHLKSVGNSLHSLEHAIYRLAVPTVKARQEELTPNLVIAKALTSNPSDSVRHSLEKLHARLVKKLSAISAQTLASLLDESRPTSRRYFHTIAEVKNFLQQPVNHFLSNHLISGLETLVTAIAYHSLRTKSIAFLSEELTNLRTTSLINTLVQNKLGPSLNTFYPELEGKRGGKDTTSPPNNSLAPSIPATHLQNQPSLPPLSFTKFVKFNRQGPVAFSKESDSSGQGVYIRVHISGIVVLCCAVIDALMHNIDDNNLNSATAHLYTALLIPHFHSMAETQASIDY